MPSSWGPSRSETDRSSELLRRRKQLLRVVYARARESGMGGGWQQSAASQRADSSRLAATTAAKIDSRCRCRGWKCRRCQSSPASNLNARVKKVLPETDHSSTHSFKQCCNLECQEPLCQKRCLLHLYDMYIMCLVST